MVDTTRNKWLRRSQRKRRNSLALVSLCALLWACSSSEDVDRLRQGVTTQLKDPSSVQFRSERIIEIHGEKVLCGEMNAKNALGGYVGFRRFVSMGTSDLDAYIEGATALGPEFFEEVWSATCAE